MKKYELWGVIVLIIIAVVLVMILMKSSEGSLKNTRSVPNVETTDEQAPLLRREIPTPGEQVRKDLEGASIKDIGRGALLGSFNLLSYHAYDSTYEDDDECDITDIFLCCWIPKLISKMCGCGYGYCDE